MSKYLATADIAATFGVDQSTVSRWVAMDRIPILGRLGTSQQSPVIYDADAVKRFGADLRKLDKART